MGLNTHSCMGVTADVGSNGKLWQMQMSEGKSWATCNGDFRLDKSHGSVACQALKIAAA